MKATYRASLQALALLMALGPPMVGASSKGGEAAGTYPGYMALDPALVVNLANPRKSRYLRLDVQFLIETPEDAAAMTTHMPLVRDRMISLLGGRDGEQIMTTEAREQLRSEMLETLRKTMSEQTGRPLISALYFTGFIVQ